MKVYLPGFVGDVFAHPPLAKEEDIATFFDLCWLEHLCNIAITQFQHEVLSRPGHQTQKVVLEQQLAWFQILRHRHSLSSLANVFSDSCHHVDRADGFKAADICELSTISLHFNSQIAK